jgi:hypothetical protein
MIRDGATLMRERSPGQTAVWIGSDPREACCDPRFHHCTECAGDELEKLLELLFVFFAALLRLLLGTVSSGSSCRMPLMPQIVAA